MITIDDMNEISNCIYTAENMNLKVDISEHNIYVESKDFSHLNKTFKNFEDFKEYVEAVYTGWIVRDSAKKKIKNL